MASLTFQWAAALTPNQTRLDQTRLASQVWGVPVVIFPPFATFSLEPAVNFRPGSLPPK